MHRCDNKLSFGSENTCLYQLVPQTRTLLQAARIQEFAFTIPYVRQEHVGRNGPMVRVHKENTCRKLVRLLEQVNKDEEVVTVTPKHLGWSVSGET